MEYIKNKELEEKEIKGIFTDMVKYAPSKLCGMFGNMIAVPIYTSLFSQQQYGLYTISIAMLSFLCIIFSDWVGLSGLRFFRRHQLVDDLPKYLSTLVIILTFNMLLMFAIAFIFKDSLYSFFHVPFKYFLAVLFLIIPVAIRALLSQLLRAQLKSISYTIATILNQFATILMAVCFAKIFNMGAASILLGMGVSISLIDILLLYQSEILKVFKFRKIEWKFIFPIICYGIPLAATSLSAWIITQSNKFIMNSISGFEKAALVGAGYGITLPILMPLFAMITVAAIPRIINLYEGKVDVRPIITKFLGYYILVALPLVTVMSLYSLDMAHIFIKNPQMYEASHLVPYFAYGVFFLAMTDYTTLQYHLANKTHIEFIIKLISGIIGVGLNFALIPKLGLTGVGIATFAANFLYCLLSIIIVIPNLNLRCPTNMLARIFVALLPAAGVWYGFKIYGNGITGVFQIATLLIVFYLVYFFGCRKLIKLPE
ncbi:polysaccharide biosynthesis C-terminal domain-containing protein [bacterium]|nr:polysaccharide biosynthesis C-terminal domain-containing protein [bacterium]